MSNITISNLPTLSRAPVSGDVFAVEVNGTSHKVDYTTLKNAVNNTTLVTKTITANGTYNPSGDNAGGYSQVTVNVPGASGMKILEYIEGAGVGEYIDTGYIVGNNTVVESILNVDADNSVWAAPYGAWDGAGSGECIFYVKTNGANNAFFCWGIASRGYDFTNYYNNMVTVRHRRGNGVVYCGDIHLDITIATGTASTTNSLYIFTVNGNGTPQVGQRCKMKLYAFNIYEGGSLARAFRPALDSNGVPGLYEAITKTFFYNQGEGSFTYSPIS